MGSSSDFNAELHETDIAIRLGRPQDGDLMAKLLLPMAFGFYGTPAICQEVEEGAAPKFIGFDETNSYLPEAACARSIRQ